MALGFEPLHRRVQGVLFSRGDVLHVRRRHARRQTRVRVRAHIEICESQELGVLVRRVVAKRFRSRHLPTMKPRRLSQERIPIERRARIRVARIVHSKCDGEMRRVLSCHVRVSQLCPFFPLRVRRPVRAVRRIPHTLARRRHVNEIVPPGIPHPRHATLELRPTRLSPGCRLDWLRVLQSSRRRSLREYYM